MADVVRDWSGAEWEQHVKRLLRLRHPDGDFVEVPARDRGDGGIEGFSRSRGIAYQCYAPEEPLSTAQLRDKIQEKIGRDTGKFVGNREILGALFQNTRIAHWILVVPRHVSRETVEYAEGKTREVRNRKLPYATDDFAITVETEAAFETELRRLKETERLKLLDFPTYDPPDLTVLAESALLDARYEVVPFLDLDGGLARIDAWRDSDARTGIRLYTGPGGIGKTRLFREICRQAVGSGWCAGFLTDNIGGATESTWLDLLRQEGRWLIVADYAEARPAEDLRRLLGAVAQTRNAPKVRLVLSARAEADWWGDLAHTSGPVGDLLKGPATERDAAPVPRLAAIEDRQVTYIAAATNFGVRLGESRRTTATPAPDLAAEHFELFLFVHIAALAAALGSSVDPSDPESLLSWAVDRHRKRWGMRLGTDQSAAQAAQACALSTLAGGADDRTSARNLLARAPKVSAGQTEAIIDLLRATEPGPRYLSAMLPDLLGEQLVSEELRRDDGLLPAALQAPVHAQREQALRVLDRLAARRPNEARWLNVALSGRARELSEAAFTVALQATGPIGRVLADLLHRAPDPDVAARLLEKLPERTVVLRELAAEVTAQCLAAARSAPGASSEAGRARIAGLANNLGNRLSHLGRREEALAAAQEATRLYRTLAEARPDAFRPDLARPLNNLANTLRNLGRPEEALAAAQEAAEHYRALAEARADAFRPDLARSLNNLGTMLSDLGRHEEALAAAQEAAGLYRTLAEARPDAFRPDLAGSLNNLGLMLGDLGRREEALTAAQESVAIRRTLAEARPDAFRPDLARSLNSLGTMLSDLGRHEEALAAAQEAAGLYRTLAEARPDAFRPDLAGSLNNLGTILSDLGRREEALAAAQEAAGLYRTLAEARPDAFRPDLAMSLNNLANRLGNLGRREEALAPAQEAAGIYRILADARPDAFRPYLAGSLSNLGAILGDLGRREEALAAAQEAAEHYRALAEARRDAFRPDLARSLLVLARCLGSLERAGEALSTINDAVAILSPAFLALPEAHAQLMEALVRDYLARAERAGAEPDRALLQPVVEALNELQAAQGKTPD